ncbi:SUMF1/EgtB/PvdO family nonheme iron enzyme [Polyangium spumosum]|uniref:SUMF1/EgtB/PvdO family nonheme iron enzyme n=1 Tax=Polyangium spumosum TaxID=889282 RepID=A0A6N7Q1G5_9BACT|nr:SUMF1/EgtB/PvdO family nonheme iron enzyme [Polyangium spumosum]
MGPASVQLTTLLALLFAAPEPAPAAPVAPPPAVCPAGTRLVEGTHYEHVQRLCTTWRRGHCYSFLPGMLALEPVATPVRVCMDEHEWPNREGKRPEVMMRFVEAEKKCASVGKRLCSEFEWELACEGPETLPWPYGHTFDADACNASKEFIPYSEAKLNHEEKRVREVETWRLYQGETSGSRPRCASSFGVKDLVGNVEEWVLTSRKAWRYRSSLKGGFWAKPWAHCRGTNDSHGPMFRYYEIGFRCCKDPEETVTEPVPAPAPAATQEMTPSP